MTITRRPTATVVWANEFAKSGGVFVWAILGGAMTIVAVRWVFVLPLPSPPGALPAVGMDDVVRVGVVVALTGILPIVLLYRRITALRMTVYSTTYAVSLVLCSELMKFVDVDLDLDIPLLSRKGLVLAHIFSTNLLLIGFVVSWLGWGLARWRKGPIVVQDGTRCPGCAYSLVGSVDRICPECGREFTYQELGTTKEELDARAEDPAEHLHLP